MSILFTCPILSARLTTERFGLAGLAGLGLAGLPCLGVLGLPCLALAWLASQPGLSLPAATTLPPSAGVAALRAAVVVAGKEELGREASKAKPSQTSQARPRQTNSWVPTLQVRIDFRVD